MSCRQCGTPTPNEAQLGPRTWPLCSPDCAQRFRREYTGRRLVAAWSGACEMWRQVDLLYVRLDTASDNRMLTFALADLRAGDRVELRMITAALRAEGAALAVYDEDALEQIEAKALR